MAKKCAQSWAYLLSLYLGQARSPVARKSRGIEIDEPRLVTSDQKQQGSKQKQSHCHQTKVGTRTVGSYMGTHTPNCPAFGEKIPFLELVHLSHARKHLSCFFLLFFYVKQGFHKLKLMFKLKKNGCC